MMGSFRAERPVRNPKRKRLVEASNQIIV